MKTAPAAPIWRTFGEGQGRLSTVRAPRRRTRDRHESAKNSGRISYNRTHRMKHALITGITGQDGSYLAELLLEQGYEVHGIVRRVALEDPVHLLGRIAHIRSRVCLHSASLESYASLSRVIQAVQPDECYHLAAQSFVNYSLDDEFTTLNSNINGTHYMLSALRELAPSCRFYFAGSSEMFGRAEEAPQSEATPLHPRAAYGISKVAGYHLTVNYREAYGLHASCGIAFNHESPRRGYEYVTRKITSTAARVYRGLANDLKLGNLEAVRDWGHAREYVRAMWLMLQQDEPGDYVIATGTPHSVREFLETAFCCLGLDYRQYVTVDPELFRPSETYHLCGNAEKARRVLGWSPQVTFEELVQEMVDADVALLDSAARPPAAEHTLHR